MIDAIGNSPSACAIVFVGFLLKWSIDKHAPDIIGALKILAAAIRANTLNERTGDSQIRESGTRQVTRRTNPKPRSGPPTGPQTPIP